MVIPARQMNTRVNRAKGRQPEQIDAPVFLHKDNIEPREGEIVFMKDGLKSKDWYCARILRKYVDRLHIHWFICNSAPLKSYSSAASGSRTANMEQAKFLPAWILKNGEPVTVPPVGTAAERDMWTGKIPLTEWDRLALVRNVGLHSDGRMNKSTLAIASTLDIPHHLGAGGSDDFVSDEVYKKHVKRAKSRKK